MANWVPGATIGGKYRIESIIGTTANATLFSCRTADGRSVVVKLLKAMLARDREDLGRFQREYDVLAQLQHPVIAAVFEYGTAEDGAPFMVHEALEGESLQARLARGPLDVRDVVGMVLQLLDALRNVHTHNVIHRDLAPGSLFVYVRPDGRMQAKIYSFAVARIADAPEKPGGGLTQFGTTLGSVEYISPEQARGGAIDGRADIYSLGCLAYAMLTGQPPFAAKQTVQVLTRKLQEDPRPVSELRPEVPDWFDKWIQRALHREPQRRFSHAAEARELLQAAMQNGVLAAPMFVPATVGSTDFVARGRPPAPASSAAPVVSRPASAPAGPVNAAPARPAPAPTAPRPVARNAPAAAAAPRASTAVRAPAPAAPSWVSNPEVPLEPAAPAGRGKGLLFALGVVTGIIIGGALVFLLLQR